jgi:hypothetical protein
MKYTKFYLLLFFWTLIIFYIAAVLISAEISIRSMKSAVREGVFISWIVVYVVCGVFYAAYRSVKDDE